MYISEITLRNFRNYAEKKFRFTQGVTAITGPNGSGKTNLLEALYVAAVGKSFRDNDDYLAREGSPWWSIEAQAGSNTRQVSYRGGSKTFLVNQTSYRRLGRQQTIPVVLFEPDHLLLVHGPPSERRKYLDRCIAQLVPGYQAILRRYERVVAQRNRLLKQPDLAPDDLFAWDISLVELASSITAKRQHQIALWNDHLCHEYQMVASSNDTVSCEYSVGETSDRYAQLLLQKLKLSYDKDRLLGSTTNGPHRDDYVFCLNDRDMVTAASRGEIRTLVLALKFIEALQLFELYNSPPLMLFDDVFSELDETRQHRLLGDHRDNQIVITSTHILANTRQIAQVSL